LVIRGANSDFVKDEDAAVFDGFFPNWKLKTVDHSGHWVHSEQPARFIDDVVDFVNES